MAEDLERRRRLQKGRVALAAAGVILLMGRVAMMLVDRATMPEVLGAVTATFLIVVALLGWDKEAMKRH